MPHLQLGGVITTLDALGPAPRSAWTGRPGIGHDFRTRYPEDLRRLAEIGVSAVRLGFDWARLQPAPGAVDDDWREWYEHVLDVATTVGIEVWATLHEATVPSWFDDEGSFADARATGKWWPRWVELAAELFGDQVAGWFPIHDPVSAAARWTADPRQHEAAVLSLAVAWRDAWRILGGGGPPVAGSLLVRMVQAVDRTVPAAEAARLEDHLRWRLWMRAWRDGVVRLPNGVEHTIADLGSSLDVLGVSTMLDLPERRVTDDSLRAWEERLGTIMRRAAEDGPTRPVTLSGLAISWPQPAERALLVDAATRAIAGAVRDRVPIGRVYVEPAIGRDGEAARQDAPLVDRDRNTDVTLPNWQQILSIEAEGQGGR